MMMLMAVFARTGLLVTVRSSGTRVWRSWDGVSSSSCSVRSSLRKKRKRTSGEQTAAAASVFLSFGDTSRAVHFLRDAH